MNILIGADHAGFELKQSLIQLLRGQGHSVIDFGTDSEASVDYPDYVHPVCQALNTAESGSFGILICGSGQGVCMTANKYPHIRAALVHDVQTAKLTRAHNDANVLCLAARTTTLALSIQIVEAFINTPFEGGRHQKRVEKMQVSSS